MDPVRMVIVVPDARIRSSFRSILEQDGSFDIVGEAGCGHAAIALALTLRPDLMLLDTQLPGLSGSSVAALVKRAIPESVLAMLTPYTDFDALSSVAKIGAATAVSRHADGETILTTIKGVLGGLARLHPWAFPAADLVVDLKDARGADSEIASTLTDEQACVLDCILLGMHVNEMPRILRTTPYRARKWYSELIDVLGVTGKVGLISLAIERGWTDRGSRPPEIAVVEKAGRSPVGNPFRSTPEGKTDRLTLTSFGDMVPIAM